MSDELKNVIITITDIQKKLTQNKDIFYKLKDDQGTTYNLFTKTKDGNESVAYQGFKILPDEGLGQTVEVSYADSAYQYQGKTVNSKNIRKVMIADESQKVINAETPVTRAVSPVMSVARGQSPAPSFREKETVDWDKIAWGKCKHAFLIELFKNGIKDIRKAEQTAEQWADMSMREKPRPVMPEAGGEVGGHVELPPDEINVEGIPF